MADQKEPDVESLIERLNAGDSTAARELFPLVLEDLHRRARRVMRRQPANHTLQPTALLNEAYLKLAGRSRLKLKNYGHFLEVASKAMQWILRDHARAKQRKKRTPTELDGIVEYYEAHSIDTLALNEALERMEMEHPLWERIVRLRYYGGASEEQVAQALDISVRSVQRHWNAARALLRSQLE